MTELFESIHLLSRRTVLLWEGMGEEGEGRGLSA